MVHRVVVDRDKCIKCGNCVKSCWQDVLRFGEDGYPVAKYPQDCQVCLICEVLCPTGAIKIMPDWSDVRFPWPIARTPQNVRW